MSKKSLFLKYIMEKALLILIFMHFNMLFSQAPQIEWQKAFGGDGTEILYSFLPTADNGNIISGTSSSGVSGDKTEPLVSFPDIGQDFWIIKTDSLGEIIWQKSIGATNLQRNPKIIQTTDGGYLISGDSNSDIAGNKTENSYGYSDLWIIRLDSTGNILWDRTLGGNSYDYYPTAIQTTDGGFLIGGTSSSVISGNKTENYVGYGPFVFEPNEDYWIIKLNDSGTIEWQNTIGGNSTDVLRDMLNTPDGGYLLGGISYSMASGDKTEDSRGFSDYWVVKLDNLGNVTWDKTIGGARPENLNAFEITNDGYLLAGTSSSPISGDKTEAPLAVGYEDFWIQKLDFSGNLLWQKVIGGLGNDFLEDVVVDNNGNFLLGGFSNSDISYNKTENSRGLDDFWVVKINSDGTVLWDKTIGGSQYDGVSSLAYSHNDDSFVIGGASRSSISGDKTEFSRGLIDYWVVKLISESLTTNNFNDTLISAHPNPTTNTVHIVLPKVYKNIDITISNVLGQIIQKKKDTNTSEIDIDLIGNNGIYFLNLINENKERITLKVIKK
jgi:hypothetical protein